MNRLIMGAAALAFVAFGSTAASASDIVVNGDFTRGFDGWNLSGVAADGRTTRVVDYTNGQKFLTGSSGSFVPQDPYGTSTIGVYFIAHQAQTISLSQTFNVATSGDYAISFDVFEPTNDRSNAIDTYLTGSFGSQGHLQNLISLDAISLDGGKVQGVTPEDGWYRFSFDKHLIAGLNSIAFSYLDPTNPTGRSPKAASAFILTNVGVTGVTGVVPEPATWGMMLLGFFGLGAMVRRRAITAATVV
jgi:hypothetical protein